ncbi:MAG: type II secretion system inner membrane protein GspF [Myxococcota bacterium]|nr:type II secretion system inner membrane protein GspF [Myxococcota bacterium]
MPAYEYKALDRSKKTVKGVVEAETPKSARSKLKKQGLFLTELDEQKGGIKKGSGINIQVDFSKFFQRVSVNDLAEMTSQLATLTSAGIPMVEALNALVDQTENQALKVILVEIREQVNQGKTLGDSLKLHPKVFNNLYVSMVTAGEQSGALDIVLKRLTEYTAATVKMRGELIGALTYPALMGLISLGVVAGLFIGVIPRIRRIFDSFDVALPLITRMMLGISDFFVGWWYLIIAALVGGIWYLRRWVKTEAGRRSWDRFMLNVPVFGRINRLVAVSRFCRTFATLLSSGVPILTAVEIVKSVVQNVILAEAIETAGQNISEGESISGPLKDSGEFPPLVTHMIAIGERTGDLEPMLQKVSDSYDQRVENMLRGLTATLEPIMIVGLGGVVMVVALSILVPMLNLSSIAR